MTRTVVWVADHGLVKAAEGINFRYGAIVLDGHPVRARYPDAWREVGTVEDDTASRIEMAGDYATLPLFLERITPLDRDAPEALPTRGPADPSDPVARGLRRSKILAARRDHYADGHTSQAIWRRLGTTKSTLLRARKDLGLKPWPDD